MHKENNEIKAETPAVDPYGDTVKETTVEANDELFKGNRAQRRKILALQKKGSKASQHVRGEDGLTSREKATKQRRKNNKLAHAKKMTLKLLEKRNK